MGINDEINYKWPFAWKGMSSPKPTVNRLLSAIIEKDVEKMECLFSQGATIEGMDESTFQRALFHLLGETPVIKCLVKHGFIRIYDNYKIPEKCIEPESYFWGIPARAWYLGNYEVFELLVQNGFGEMFICSKGEGYEGVELIAKKNDIRAAKILLENGYPRWEFEREANRWPDSSVVRFLQENPVVHRKSFVLDYFKFKTIPKPQLETPGIFNRKKVEKRNAIIMEDYKDRLSAQNRFIESIGRERWKNIVKEKEEGDELITQVMMDILENGL